MVIIGVTEDAIHATTNGAQFGDGRLFDRHARGEVFVAVEETRGAVERVTRVIHRRTLFRSLMSGAEENPLFRRRHLRATLGITLGLELDRQSVQFQAELSQVLVFPHSLILQRKREKERERERKREKERERERKREKERERERERENVVNVRWGYRRIFGSWLGVMRVALAGLPKVEGEMSLREWWNSGLIPEGKVTMQLRTIIL